MATSVPTTTTPTTTTPTSTTTATPPTIDQSMANWSSNLAQALQMYEAQVRMDADQQAVAFASSVEAKGNQMIMACIQNIR
jgi:hypothetical protein